MITDSKGNEVYIESVSGPDEDNLLIDHIYYVNELLPKVPEEEINYIYDHHYDKLVDMWKEYIQSCMDDIYENYK
jgi:hypothetical protein